MTDQVFSETVTYTVTCDRYSKFTELAKDPRFSLNMRPPGDHRTLLQLAVANKATEVIIALLDLGTSTTITEDQGRTPLYQAIRGGLEHEFVLRRLMQGGAATITDRARMSAWHVAARIGNCRVLKLLLEVLDPSATSLPNAKRDLPKATGMHAPCNSGFTPLLNAITAGKSDCAMMLAKASITYSDWKEDW
ncbi:ankyrin [Byssothecium circinans]|uniref:Ankyrin n=1 Tax=Byssothecium circinans TaxID=147558 RepID=A0A6A5UCN4_9PLEO|nr:ankyrin [Byssothecium circinans]